MRWVGVAVAMAVAVKAAEAVEFDVGGKWGGGAAEV